VGSAVFILFLYNTGSRAATLAGLLVIGFHQFLIGQISKKIIGGILAAPLLLLVVPLLDPSSNYVTRAFSQDYIQEAMNQRLGIVLLVVPHFLSNLSLTDIMFGLSLDQRVLATMVADMFQVPLALLSQIGMIEDVYWAAILVYFGVVGMGFWLGMLLSIFGRLWTLLKWARTDLQQRLGHLALLVLGISFPLNLLGQYYEIRQFSFYLWILVGLAVGVIERQKRQS
jgi:TM2 domain-containing membrane protein YozV